MLQKDEIKRYNRQIILPELGIAGQEKLKAARVLMIGAGGLGCPVLQYLAAAGAGTLGIIDNDVVSESNLHRQILYTGADVGQNKAIVAKNKLCALNPFININAYTERFTAEVSGQLLNQYDLVIDGSDNFPTRYLVNDACIYFNKPLVFGSIYKFEGQVSVFNYLNGPNYRDLFPEPPAAEEVPNCAEIGVIGVIAGLVGLHMANEAIKIITGIGETLSGKLMIYDALNSAVNYFKIAGSGSRVQKPVPQNKEDLRPGEIANEITLADFLLWQQQAPDEVFLVDVREPYEYEDYNIGGLNISLYELTENVAVLPEDKTLVFCCQSGQRSKMAIHMLSPLFKGKMLSMKGGLYE